MATGLAVLSGLLGGLAGLPRGIQQATEEDLARTRLGQGQQQIDELMRHRQAAEGQTAAMNALRLQEAEAKRQAATQLETMRGQIPEQARPFYGIPGGAELYGKLFPQGATPQPFTPPAGYRPIPTVSGKGEVSTRYEPPSQAREIAEGALKSKGWTPEMPGYAEALYQLMTPLTPVTEGGFAVPRTQTVPAPPRPAAAINPALPLAQQPTVQAAGVDLKNAVTALAQAVPGLPGVPAAPGPQRLPGGGIQGPPKTQAIGQEQVQKLADIKTFLSALDTAEQLHEPGFTGPIEGRLGAGRQFSGIRSTPKETQFRTVLQSFANQLLYLRSGAAVTPQEYERILRELPTANDPDDVFKTKLTTARMLLQEAVKNREAEFAKYGFRGAQPSSMAPAPAAPTPARRRFNPATGRLE